MFLQQKPIPGYWYSNQSGQLIQVRAIVFTGGRGSRIVIEDISGKRQSLDVPSWRDMDLVLHSPVADRDSRNRRRNHTDES
ncbi:MAG: hypothetical protein HKP57_07450 [Halobacteria archaeon]|nr:hypothetical protein [Halobacteria archaeon]